MESVRNFWNKTTQCVEHISEAEDEHAGIPESAAGGDKLFGAGARRLFDELFRAGEGGGGGGGEAFAGEDVAVAGFGRAGSDADGEKRVFACGDGRGIAESLGVAFGIGDDVICGDDGEDGIRVACGEESGDKGDAGRGVFAVGFGDDVVGRELGQFFADVGGVVGGGDDEDMVGRGEVKIALDCFSDEGARSGDGEELFRAGSAASGPETFTFAAGHDADEEG